MAGDLNREASELWNALKPIIDKEIDARTQGVVQRRKAKVTTAPSLITNTVGVTEPFGSELFLPFTTNIISASVGDVVWVEYMYGMTNAFVSMFASADDKDRYVAGNLTVLGNTSIGGVLDVTNRRAQAVLSSPGWYRVLTYTGTSTYQPDGATGALIRFNVVVWGNTSANGNHQIDLSTAYGTGHREFVNEFSNGQDTLIDKIRYTKKDNNFYVDVHFTGNANNTVTVYFDPMIAIVAFQSRITANNLEAVADAPSGETVVTTYEFSQTGVHFGDTTVGGVLGVTNRQAYARLSSAGWYRVCWLEGATQYSPIGALGALIRFNIVVYGNDGNNGNHQIDYISTYGTGNRKFVNEQSNGVDTKVDKIRCMRDGNDFYIDIHFTASSNTDVYIFWDFFTALSFLGKLTTKNLAAVADAPSGETSLAEYSFASSGVFFGDLFTNGLLLLPFLTDGEAIASNADLDNTKTAGVYYATSSVASTLSNSSITTVPFKLIVMPGNASGVWQIELAAYSNCVIALRYFNGATWGAWKRLTPA